jgi:TonB family protein
MPIIASGCGGIMRRFDVVLSAALGVALFAGSSWLARADQPAPAPGAVAAAAATMSPRPGIAFEVSNATSIDAYKRHFADRVTELARDRLADKLPVILKGVIVLDVTIDREGNIAELKLWRSNGYEDIEKIALESVRQVGRFPAPSDAVLGGQQSVRFLETWLFSHDGKFRVRSTEPKDWKPTLPPEGGTRTAKR